jgi:uncharacterized protein YndB with AHSA1/START domain
MITDAAVADAAVAPVRQTITVKASAERAFRVFTAEIDSWWPRTHHIGKVPMQKNLIEGRVGGRCYSEQIDGSECDWGEVLVWEPPARFILAWKINGAWQYEPDLAKSSEVEVRFTPQPDGTTRVDLEHRHLERMETGAAAMRTAIEGPGGWPGILQLFTARVEAEG